MKFSLYTVLFALFVNSVVFAQTRQEKELQEQFWNASDPAKNVTEVPAKWQNQSAVILYKEDFYEYTNNGKKMYSPSYSHRRVKLLDKAAVEYFSEFSYEKDSKIGVAFVNYSNQETIVGAKIVKPDGTQTILDINSEVVSQDDTNKLAIPGLEVGDILDLYIYEDDYLRSFSGTHIYEPVEKLLSGNYPILYQKIAVEVENDYFLNMETYNGAPAIVEEPTDKKATKRYVMVAQDIEATSTPRWFYPFNELPAIKFQVVFALKWNNEAAAAAFLGDSDGERKNGVTKEEILEYYNKRFSVDKKREVRNVLEYLEDKGITDKREQLETALYFIRHMSFNRFIELVLAYENEIASPYDLPCDEDYIILDENKFVTYMAGLAKQLEIDYDIVIATPAYNGSIDDLLLRSNVSYGLRFNFEEPLYFFDIGPHVQADIFPWELEGTKVYTIGVRKNKSLENVSEDVLPITTANQNMSSGVVNVSLNPDFSGLSIDRTYNFSGHFKAQELEDRVLFVDYLEEEFDYYGTPHFYNCKKRQSRGDAEIEQKLNALYNTIRDGHAETLKEGINWGLELNDYTYQVVASSRFSKDDFVFKDQFTLDEQIIKKAGPNYIVNVGQFIGGQVQLMPQERLRANGVNINFAKTFKYQVRIKIPEGYEAVGVDKLNMSFQNATGAFISTAVIEGDELVYTTSKVYAKSAYTAQEWPNMIEWLDAAYEFSQSNIMFKKL